MSKSVCRIQRMTPRILANWMARIVEKENPVLKRCITHSTEVPSSAIESICADWRALCELFIRSCRLGQWQLELRMHLQKLR